MNPIASQLTFVPATGQLFLWAGGAAGPLFESASGGPATLALGESLRALGWPTTARILGPGAPEEPVAGTLIELIDALPVLCAAAQTEVVTAPTALAGWAVVARAALDLLAQGALLPRLSARSQGPGDGRVSGWEARWTAVCRRPEDRTRLSRLARCLGAPQIAVVRRGRAEDTSDLSPRGLLLRVLDACADMLVREAARRGGAVRLGGIPADAWEQRLVRALGDDDATFAAGGDAERLCEELSAFTRALTQHGPVPGVAESPESWRAAEPLQKVLARMTQPAALLAHKLLEGKAAPRTLPAAAPAPLSKLSQAVAVTRTILQLTGPSASRASAQTPAQPAGVRPGQRRGA